MSNVPSQEKLAAALDRVFIAYPGTRMNVPYVMGAMMRDLCPPLQDWCATELACGEAIRLQVAAGAYSISFGRSGGLIRNPSPIVNHTPVNQEGEATVVNNHVCPSCGNNRVNKDERSCWKCGGSL